LAAALDDLESRIEDDVERELWRQWRDFARGACKQEVFVPRRPRPRPSEREWPRVPINAALEDFEAMALQAMGFCSQALAEASGKILNVRCNYGSPIMPMLFGVELFRMPEATDTLPACHPLPGGAEALRRLLDAGEPSLDQPYMNRVWEMGRRFKAIQARYPKIGRHVHLYHPDFQGPLDILEMVVGSALFMLLMDEPELVHQALELITRTYIRAMRRWQTIQPAREDGLTTHWGLVHPGAIMLRDDSAMNLSPAMFAEFVQPYDQRLLAEFGGGAIHACGRVEHFVPFLPEMPGLTAFNMSQPRLNDMATVWRNTVERGLLVIDADGQAVHDALAAGQRLHGRVHVGYPNAALALKLSRS
jgi:hypothetical protein